MLTAATTTAFLFIFGNTIRHHSSPRNRVKFTASDWYYHTKGVRKSSEASYPPRELPHQLAARRQYYHHHHQNHGHHQLTVVNQFYILELKASGCQNGSELQLNLSALL